MAFSKAPGPTFCKNNFRNKNGYSEKLFLYLSNSYLAKNYCYCPNNDVNAPTYSDCLY